MAIEYTLYCDGCGSIIDASRKGIRDVRATAQLQCGAYCGRDGDYCRPCRLERTRLTPEQHERAAANAHSIGGPG